MICPNCKKEYNNSLFSCPYCGAVNRNTYKDIEMKELKEKVIDSFFQDLKTSPKSLIKELPLLVLAIIIFAIAYFLNIYYFTKLETCYQCGYETAIKAIKGKIGEILKLI